MPENCEGDIIDSLTFKWEDGDQVLVESFTLPQRGCYCLRITEDDLSIAKAKIEMTSHDGDYKLDFSTEE
jgi:hypothetical protein